MTQSAALRAIFRYTGGCIYITGAACFEIGSGYVNNELQFQSPGRISSRRYVDIAEDIRRKLAWK